MGEFAALLTAFFWAMSSIFFTLAGKQFGSIIVNRIRLVIAVALVMLTHLVLQGQLLPLSTGGERWFWLGLSGIVGLVIGDTFLFEAYILVGTRISTLLMAFAPVIAAVIAWLFLGESLGIIQVAGIALAVGGIALVVLERGNGNPSKHDLRRYVLGVLCGLGAAAGQAGGLVLAKKGLAGDFPAISGVVIRMLVAMVALWLLTLVSGQVRHTLAAFRELRGVRLVALGSLVGPFIGVWLSLVAVQLTYVGIASTLMALTPIIILPFSERLFKERVSLRAISGTAVALAGVAVIFLTPPG